MKRGHKTIISVGGGKCAQVGFHTSLTAGIEMKPTSANTTTAERKVYAAERFACKQQLLSVWGFLGGGLGKK